MLSIRDPAGNRVPLPENTSNTKQGQEPGITSVCLNKLRHSKSPSHAASTIQWSADSMLKLYTMIQRKDMLRMQQEWY